MLYNLDLTLLEVFFLYSLKKGKNDIFSMSAHLPSLQLVTELPDSIKGGAKGLVVVRGGWAGLLERPSRPFSPNYSLMIPGRFALRFLSGFYFVDFLLTFPDGILTFCCCQRRSGKEGPYRGLGGKGVFCLCQ